GKDCIGTGSYADDNGHGTHAAGTAAAKDNNTGVVGVAPGARLWAVKVLAANGSGSYSSLICGVDWVTQNAGTIGVANLSLAGTAPSSTCTADLQSTDPFHEAICRSVNAGVTYAVAAGNSSADASAYVPASFNEIITVSAVNDQDGKPGGDSFASFSNYGSAVDIAAPGVGILSTLNTGGYGKMSGTSMASPHVAGAVALVIAAQGRIGPAGVKSALLSSREQTALTGDPDGISEGILAVGNGYAPGSPTPTPTATPQATATPTSGTTTGSKLSIVGATRSSGSTSPLYAYDNNTTTSWYTTTSTAPTSAYITLDMGAVRTLSSIRWQFRVSGYADRMYIQISSTGTSWSTLGTRTNATAGTWQSLSTTASARYVRFYFTNPNKDPRLGYLAEVEVYGSGTTTSATSVDTTATPGVTSTAESTSTPTSTATATSTIAPTVTATVTPTETATMPATEEPSATPEAPTSTPTATPTETPIELVVESPTAKLTAPLAGAGFGTATVANTGGAGGNCRVEPNTDALIVAVLPEGTVVELTGSVEGEWQPVVCEGQAGYVNAAYLVPGDGERLIEPTATLAIDLAIEPALSEPVGPPGMTPTPTPAGPTPFPIFASGQTENSSSSRLVWDGDPTTYWVTVTGIEEEVAAFTLDLGEIKPVGEVRCVYAAGDLGGGLSIQFSEDERNWETVEQPGGTPVGVWQEERVNVAARYIRFHFTNPYGTSYLGGIGEVEVLPADGSVRPLVIDPPTPEPTPGPTAELTEPTVAMESEPVLESGRDGTVPPTEETVPLAEEETPPSDDSEGLG
ncbi:MAG TPA: S8 family serine peptidase, partial [Thermomicrobiales bacterium]|nr:S8 family serine peptidase [Thermomicrobiales bacterium]